MRILSTLGLVLFLLFSMVGAGYSVCEGDLNCDGVTDGSDLAQFAADFGTTGCGTCDDVINELQVLQDRITQLETLLMGVTRNGDSIIFEGVNVQIIDGTGSTEVPLGSQPNGLGNLIVGYDENDGTDDKSGSHNIVVGRWHSYSAWAGIVIGDDNTISAAYASVSGGRQNTASGTRSSVSGGQNNTASGDWSNVSGGYYNIASGKYTFIGGGGQDQPSGGNEAYADYSAILGGSQNFTGDDSNNLHYVGMSSTISGGSGNMASGSGSSVSGGSRNWASGGRGSVCGGSFNTANGYDSTVSGGVSNTAGATFSSVSGGSNNTASGNRSSVSGGYNHSISDLYDWQAGSLFEDQ